ncbi:MAG: hypothetical protein K6E96_08085 [Bacteroidales bacterium]|nr:hypothetical protein [Bacteroidales bacterium]
MKRKQRHLFWLFFPLLCLLTVAGAALLTYWRHTVPLSQTSEVYRRYRDFPGVDAAFIRQMPINDTLRVDMTLLQARDSLAFANLLRDMGKSEEYIRDMATLKAMYEKRGMYNVRFTGTSPRGHPGQFPDPDPDKNEEYSVFPVRLIVAVFHTHNEEEALVVFHKSRYGELDIDNQK